MTLDIQKQTRMESSDLQGDCFKKGLHNMKKTPFVTKEQIEEIAKTYPTPFHIYDEKGIRENARCLLHTPEHYLLHVEVHNKHHRLPPALCTSHDIALSAGTLLAE